MTTSAFLQSFKHFTARQGLPRKIVSNNGKTFKAAAKTIDAVIRHEDFQRHFAGVALQYRKGTMVGRDVREDDPVYQVLFEGGGLS